MAQLSRNTQDTLSKFASKVSRNVSIQLARAASEAGARAKRHQAAEKQEEQRRLAEQERKEAALAKLRQLAAKGLERLLAVGSSDSVQRAIAAVHQLSMPAVDITFYTARRFDGDSWFQSQEGNWDLADSIGQSCAIDIAFCDAFLLVDFEYADPQRMDRSAEWRFYYAGKVERRGPSGKPSEESVENFFREVEHEHKVQMPRVRDVSNHSCGWCPEELGFQLLVNCARASTFTHYLGACLQEFTRSLRV